GLWHDWKTGELVTGPCKRAVKVTPEWGGSLFVRAGAVIPMWEKKAHVDKGWDETVELHVWPGADGKGDLYEDDGVSLEYRSGKGALTTCAFKDGALTVGPRTGTYSGMPATRKMKAVFHKANSLETVTVELGDVGTAGTGPVRCP
ncbi:MAG TPA: DUF5110 domain-containing protein, partial [Kiritimatiellia bacterium]|nr:DUF5110 domain-containing protein [Kiritimatiellia bacterium]